MFKKINSKLIFILFLALILGCAKNIQEAKDYAEKSNLYYQKAVQAYKSSSDRLNLGLLYYSHGEYEKAMGEFKLADQEQAKKFLGISYYKLGDYTSALETFQQLESLDDAEYLYCYGLTSERLNLYDQALNLYHKIKSGQYKKEALERTNIINKSKQEALLKDLDGDIRNIILQAPDAAKYPQAGALILHCDENIEITSQNTLISDARYVVKIINDRGKEEFSEVQTEYDSTFEKIELVYARIIKPSGEVVYVGQKHIRDVSKYLNFPLYSNVRVHIISFPEITEGAVLDYKIKVYRNRLVNKKDFATAYSLQSMEPIIFCKFSISMPKARKLNMRLINQEYNKSGAELKPKITENQDKKIYSWEFKNIPQIIPEQQMPSASEINPEMLVSTFDSWDQIYQWWWNLAKDKINVDSSIKNKVAELITGLKTDKEKARAIYNFCAKDIRYVAVEYGQAGHEPHRAEEIFRNKYGDCKDQAILLVSMLKEAGLNAYPVLISTKDNNNMIEDFPSILFNHAIAVVKLGEEYIFLDPTASTCSFQDLPTPDQDRRVLVFQEDSHKIIKTPLLPANNNLVQEELKIKANIDGSIEAKKKSSTFGYYDQGRRYWLLYTPPQLIEETLKERIQEVSIGAQLENYTVENAEDLNKPTVIDYNFKGSDYFIVAGDIFILPQLSAMNTALVAKEERRYPLDFEALDRQEKKIEVKLPEGFRVRFLPAAFEKDSPWMRIKIAYSFDKNTLYYSEVKELKKTAVSLSEYQDFKKFIEEAAKFYKQRIVLEKINPAPF